MASLRVAVIVTYLIIFIRTTFTLKILVLSAVQIRSHCIFANAVTTALLEHGHHVYELTSMEPIQHPNRTSFVIENAIIPYDVDLASVSDMNIMDMISQLSEWSVMMCEEALKSTAAKNLLSLARDWKNRPHIDVIVYDYIFHECLGSYVTEFGNPPIVAITAYGNSIEVDELLGSPTFPSFVPHDMTTYAPHKPMTWLQRLYNKIVYLWSDYSRLYYQYPKMDDVAKRYFGANASSVEEIRERVAVVLTNSHPVFNGARPQLPSVIQIGGIHLNPPRKISDVDLKKFIDTAKNGFIYMSFGSVMKVSLIDSSRRRGLMKAFDRLRARKVVLKWEKSWDEEADGPVPDNVFISPWLPQNDILAHPNIRVFVTHCGGLSTIEIIQRGVPVIAVPFFMDQFKNAHRLVEMKLGRLLKYADLKADTFFEAVNDILNDEKYMERMRKLSALVRDDINSPKEKAVFWVEFVARHRGVPHLKSPARFLPWISRWMVDDIFIFVPLIVFVVILTCGACKRIGNLMKKSKRKEE